MIQMEGAEMKTLTQIFLVVSVVLLLPFFLVFRLFGWRPQGQNAIQSHFPSKPEGFAIVSPEQSERQPYPYVQVNNDGSARELHKAGWFPEKNQAPEAHPVSPFTSCFGSSAGAGAMWLSPAILLAVPPLDVWPCAVSSEEWRL